MREFYLKNKDLIQKAFFIAAILVGIYLFVNFLFRYISPFAIGYIIALLLEPLVNLLYVRLKINRGLSAIVLIVLTLGLLIGLGLFLTSKIYEQALSFSENVPKYIDSTLETLKNSRFEIDLSSDIVSSITTSVTSILGVGIGQGGVNLVKNLPSAALYIILLITSAFFFIKDKHLIERKVKSLFPEWLRTNCRNLKTGIGTALAGYAKAQLIIMSVVGSLCLIGLAILNYPYALLIAVILAIIDALPVFGTGIILVPWALYNILAQDYKFAIGLLIISMVVFLVRRFLEPKVLSDQIGVHPLILLISIYVGLKLFGSIGFILGPIIAVVVKISFETTLNFGEQVKNENKSWDN